MRYLIMALCLLFACPAWGEYKNPAVKEIGSWKSINGGWNSLYWRSCEYFVTIKQSNETDWEDICITKEQAIRLRKAKDPNCVLFEIIEDYPYKCKEDN